MKRMNMKSKRPISLQEARVLQMRGRTQPLPGDLGFAVCRAHSDLYRLLPSKPQPGRRRQMDTHLLWGIRAVIIGRLVLY